MATITKRGKSWQLNWSEGGHQHRRSLGSVSQEEAEAVLKIKEAEILTGVPIAGSRDSSGVTFNEFYPDYLAWHSAEYPSDKGRTRQIVYNHLTTAFGNHLLDAIPPYEVELWKARRIECGAATATVNKELATLKKILNKAVEWEVIDRHRLRSVKKFKNVQSTVKPYFTNSELRRILKAAKHHGAVWQFMANTGMRRAEMLNAKRSDIKRGKIQINSTLDSRTKSGKYRVVKLSRGALAALPRLGDDHLAPQMVDTSFSRCFRLDVKAAGLPDGKLHWLRHTFCSHLVMAGVDLRTVQELAGHSDFKTTLNYAHLSAAHVDEAVAGLNLGDE